MKHFELLLCPEKILLYKEGKFIVETEKVVGVKEGRIDYIGPFSQDLKAQKIIKLERHLLSPGLVNTHTHLPMSLFRGLADDLPLKSWLEDYIFPLEANVVDQNFISVGTRLSAIELIKSGVTSFFDMYFYNEVMAQALDEAGLRAFVGVGVPSVEKDSMEWKKKTKDLKQKYEGHSRINIAIAPHAPYTLTSKCLKEIGDFSKKESLPLTIHVSESEWEQQEIQKKYGRTPVQYLHDLNVTGEQALFVHCVYVNEEDLKIMSKTGTSFSYNPESNMKLSNGIAPVGEALKQGVVVGLGTDGSASNNNLNLFQEMDTGIKLQSLKYKDQSLDAQQMFQMATLGGAKALGLEKDIGTIEEGKRADLIAIELEHAHLYPPHNLVSHLVYSAQGSEVSFVMCEGRILMENHQLQTLNAGGIYEEASLIEKKIKSFLNSR
ncbi:MAG: amidohydrolase family protein [Bdellovibrionales bacterium]